MIPITPDINALKGLSEIIAEIMVKANRQIENISIGPNFKATCASGGAMKTKANMERIVPRKE